MIIRIWEAQVSPLRVEEFCARLASTVLPGFDQWDGFLGGELLCALVDDDHRVQMITRWRDEEALRAYAGPMWRIRPVWSEDELHELEHPPTVAHFHSLRRLDLAVGEGAAPAD
ncbi:antibiotic biosynthesis monooxygenase family protein [Kitasatospora sp. NPDC004615]|uniref:antibiotic biosynthesis monooxygenase family protein n=1 Tax=Kitasatospora sp. NPDC004615 TaxID=3364017 RepID=UPI003699BC5A